MQRCIARLLSARENGSEWANNCEEQASVCGKSYAEADGQSDDNARVVPRRDGLVQVVRGAQQAFDCRRHGEQSTVVVVVGRRCRGSHHDPPLPSLVVAMCSSLGFPPRVRPSCAEAGSRLKKRSRGPPVTTKKRPNPDSRQLLPSTPQGAGNPGAYHKGATPQRDPARQWDGARVCLRSGDDG